MKKTGLQVVGHRGARGLAPENTLTSIAKALKHGVVEIEIDVHITKDSVPILCHNPWLLDASGKSLVVSQTNYKELLDHKPDLATLEQAIIAIDRRVPLQIELKWGELTAPVITLLRGFLKRGWLPADFLLASKKQKTLMELHQALPEIPTVVIEPYLSLRAHWRARQLGTKRLSMNYFGLWGGFIQAIHRNDYQLYAYTLNNPAKARKWHKRGLHGVITDRPDLFE